MKSCVLFYITFFLIAFFNESFSQEDYSEKVTPEAIKERIEKYRMGNITIKTKPGSDIKIQQVRHEFLFGTAIPNSLAENEENSMTSEERKKYIEILAENFNYAVHENALKWYDCEKEQDVVDYTTADRIYAVCDSLNIPMRGHCIFWAKDEFLMDWLKELNNDELRKAVNKRAIGVISHFKNRINEFDLNNEMIHGDFFRKRLGYGIINEMAYMVKYANPDAKLYMNDYGILDLGYNTGAYIMQIENLLANGIPIDGIGCQAHRSAAGEYYNSPERVQRALDRLSKFNLPIKITEALFTFDDEEIQARELKKLFPVYFAHPNVEAIIMWGFWAGDHWQPHAAMWRKDFSPGPQAIAYRDLVFNQWWTNVSDKADETGLFKSKAFFGKYLITSEGVTKEINFTKEYKSIVVTFE